MWNIEKDKDFDSTYLFIEKSNAKGWVQSYCTIASWSVLCEIDTSNYYSSYSKQSFSFGGWLVTNMPFVLSIWILNREQNNK